MPLARITYQKKRARTDMSMGLIGRRDPRLQAVIARYTALRCPSGTRLLKAAAEVIEDDC